MARTIDFPFRIERGRVVDTTDYRRIVRAQVVDALMTNWRERVMLPEHGCDIQTLLYHGSDQLRRSDAANVISNRLSAVLVNSRGVSRATIIAVEVVPDPTEPSLVYIRVDYRASDYDDVETLEVPVVVENNSGAGNG